MIKPDPWAPNPQTPQSQVTGDCGESTTSNATETCEAIALAEGNGTYTQTRGGFKSASGRYQFVGSTAVAEIKKIGAASTTAAATELWEKCRGSSTSECRQLQDDLCKSYSSYIKRSLNNRGIPPTVENIYLAWNQGPRGAAVIYNAMKTGSTITDPEVLSNMQGQAWEFSANGQTFYNNMLEHIQERNVPVGRTYT